MSNETIEKIKAALGEGQVLRAFAIDVPPELEGTVKKLMDSGDQAGIEQLLEKQIKADALQKARDALRVLFMRDVILNTHYCLHDGQLDRAKKLMCAASDLIDDQSGEADDLLWLLKELNDLNLARAKHGCVGSA